MVEDGEPAIAERNHSVVPQALECAIDVDGCQPDRISERILIDRKRDRPVMLDATNDLRAPMHSAKEMR